jgi:hypothetical protein
MNQPKLAFSNMTAIFLESQGPKPKFPGPAFKEKVKPVEATHAEQGSVSLHMDRRVNVSNWKGAKVPLAAKAKHSVYITDCKDTTVTITTKVNRILIDGCENCTIRFSSVICSVEVVRCKQVTVYCQERVPLCQIDMTDGCRVYAPSHSVQSTKIVYASAVDIDLYEVQPESRVHYPLHTSMFSDQMVAYFQEGSLHTASMESLKKGAYTMLPN